VQSLPSHSEQVTEAPAPAESPGISGFASRAPWRRLPYPLRLLAVTALGTGSLLVGAALLVLPGPGLVFLALGLAILATEFVWAKTLLHRATTIGSRGWHKARALVGKPSTHRDS
jgi:hypothetical protein